MVEAILRWANQQLVHGWVAAVMVFATLVGTVLPVVRAVMAWRRGERRRAVALLGSLWWLQLALVVGVSVMAYLRLIPVALSAYPWLDDVGHFTLFGLLAAGLTSWSRDRRLSLARLRVPLAHGVVLPIVALEEALQALSPARTCSWGDLAADVAGISVGWLLVSRLCRGSDEALSV